MTTSVQIILQAVDQASKEIGKVSSSLEGIDDAAKKSSAGASANLKSLAIVAGGTAAAFAAVAAASKAAFDFGKQGAVIQQTQESFANLLEQVGAAPDTLEKLRESSRGTVDDMTLMSSTATLLAGTSGDLALSLADATPRLLEIAKAAQKVNPTLGDTSFLYQSIATGIKRAQPDILDNLGLTIKVGEANEKYARQLGKSVEALTANEKQQALLNATLEAGGILIEQAGGDADSATDSFSQLETTIKNLADAYKEKFVPVMSEAAAAINDLLLAGQKVVVGFSDTEKMARSTAKTYQEYINKVVSAAEAENIAIKISGDHVEVLHRTMTGTSDLSDEVTVLTEEQWKGVKASEGNVEWFKQLAGIMPVVSAATKEAADKQEELNLSLGDLKSAISGGFGKEIEDYNSRLYDTKKKYKDIVDQINILENLPGIYQQGGIGSRGRKHCNQNQRRSR